MIKIENAQVQEFVDAIYANARRVWTEPDDESFVKTLLHVTRKDDGSYTIGDNYERFFNGIYTVTPAGEWTLRFMYSDRGEMTYSYEQAMCDASMMYTG